MTPQSHDTKPYSISNPPLLDKFPSPLFLNFARCWD
ncbi:solute carrier family 35 (UDP-galactose transporter), member B1 [Cryptococcus neoformans Ze90-1]|nr:solute carrier family 35 (UDP-galactose transporter), member B1 [Cryptococcus neoformans var. grubii Ze90-1]